MLQARPARQRVDRHRGRLAPERLVVGGLPAQRALGGAGWVGGPGQAAVGRVHPGPEVAEVAVHVDGGRSLLLGGVPQAGCSLQRWVFKDYFRRRSELCRRKTGF